MVEELERLKDSIPLLEYLQRHNWKPCRAGSRQEWVGLCPLHHETRPSFYVNARKNLFYCHGCGHLCETAAKGVPVATVLRYLRYYEVYGKRQEARALYQALPPTAREFASADLQAAAAACPHGLPVVDLIERANRQMRA